MSLKQSFSHSQWVLQTILFLTVPTVFLAIQTLIPLFPLTVLNFILFFQVIKQEI